MSASKLISFCLAWNIFIMVPAWAQLPGAGQEGPWNRNLELYESADGKDFTYKGIFVEHGGVPHCIRYWSGEILCVFQWFPLDKPDAFDQIALMMSQDDGKTWTKPQKVEIAGMPQNLHRAFDPTLTALEDGRLRLYFTSERISPEQKRGDRAIFSALSTDGVHYQFEKGQRFGFPDQETYDAAVISYKGTLHLFCPISGKDGVAYHAVSKDGLHFTKLVDAVVSVDGSWIGNAIALDQEMRFYGSSPEGVWMASSKEGGLWQVDESMSLAGGDPTIVEKKDGTFLAITTGLTKKPFRLQ